jgi:Fe-S cluster biogenesis protein NfuA
VLILTEQTPNPDALKFLPHARLTDGAAHAFDREDFDPKASALAARLFALGSVRHVLIAEDFVSVTRDAAGEGWASLKIKVIAEIADHLAGGAPAVAFPGMETSGAESQVESEIRQVLGLYVRPGVARDGGDILFDRFDAETGVLWIRMQGACGGCPSSRLTLKAGIERIVRRYVPEVLSVEEATDGDAEPQEGVGARLKRWADRLRSGAPGGPPGPLFTHRGEVVRGPRDPL